MKKHTRAKPCTIDDIRFASKLEGRRYTELKLLANAGLIVGLELQPKFQCVINGKKCFTYTADFTYWDNEIGRQIIEDVKGREFRHQKIMIKVIEALYKIKIDLLFNDPRGRKSWVRK